MKNYMENGNENLFTTRDLYLASTLLCLKFNLVSLNMQVEGLKNQPIGYFNFLLTPELNEVEGKYWARRLAVEPIEFFENLYNLKTQVTKVYMRPRVDTSNRNICFAAVLLTLKFPLLNINYKTEGVRRQLIGYFNFEENSKLEKAREDYLDRKLAVEPLMLVSNFRGLKARMTTVFKSPHIKLDKKLDSEYNEK